MRIEHDLMVQIVLLFFYCQYSRIQPVWVLNIKQLFNKKTVLK